jgi:hypothetical protein
MFISFLRGQLSYRQQHLQLQLQLHQRGQQPSCHHQQRVCSKRREKIIRLKGRWVVLSYLLLFLGEPFLFEDGLSFEFEV